VQEIGGKKKEREALKFSCMLGGGYLNNTGKRSGKREIILSMDRLVQNGANRNGRETRK